MLIQVHGAYMLADPLPTMSPTSGGVVSCNHYLHQLDRVGYGGRVGRGGEALGNPVVTLMQGQ